MKMRSERVFIDGKRFEAAVSPNRKLADIKDKGPAGLLILVDFKGLEELSNLLQWLLGSDEELIEGRFTAFMSADKKWADVLDHNHSSKGVGHLMQLDRAAISELSLLVEELSVMMAS